MDCAAKHCNCKCTLIRLANANDMLDDMLDRRGFLVFVFTHVLSRLHDDKCRVLIVQCKQITMAEPCTCVGKGKHALHVVRKYVPSMRPRSSLFSIALVTATLADASKAMLSVTAQHTPKLHVLELYCVVPILLLGCSTCIAK